MAEIDLSNARMNISVDDLEVYPVRKALAIELVGLGIGVAKLTITGADPLLRGVNSKIENILPAVVAPTVISGLALAQYPTCIDVHELGWCLNATTSLFWLTSWLWTDHSVSAGELMLKDWRAKL